MSDEIEAAGATITAGMAAGAIEPRDPHRAGDHGPCGNCGAEVTGRFCTSCGQASHVHRTLFGLAEEAVHGILHFDGKIWRTLPRLFFRPGTLTRDYVAGKRARFVSPVAMFLFSVFLMFLAYASFGEAQPTGADAGNDVAAGVAAGVQGAKGDPRDRRQSASMADLDKALAETDAKIAELVAAGETQKASDARITRAILAGAREGRYAIAYDGKGSFTVADPSDVPAFMSQMISTANTEKKPIFQTGSAKLDKKFQEKLSNPELFGYKLLNNSYKFSFFLIPLSIPVLWLLFAWKRGVTLYDHGVFVIYSLSFVSLVFLLIGMINRFAPGVGEVAIGLLVFAIPVHMFFQVGGAYQLGWFSALWRTLFLVIAAFAVLMIWLLIIVVLGFL